MNKQWHGGKGSDPRPRSQSQEEIDRREDNWRNNPENKKYDEEKQRRE